MSWLTLTEGQRSILASSHTFAPAGFVLDTLKDAQSANELITAESGHLLLIINERFDSKSDV